VERWRTRAVLGALVLIAAGGVVAVVLAQTDDSSQASKPGRRPQLSASAQNPFTVKGTGFRKGERVHVVVKGSGGAVAATTRANRQGRFRVVLKGVKGCDSVNVAATGSMGSHASFNLSSYVCP
jgi:hypothetical protein